MGDWTACLGKYLREKGIFMSDYIGNAKNHYLGKGGAGKHNCAQAVLKAFSDKYNIDDQEIKKYSSFGGGNAPEGICGAYYAAKNIVGNNYPQKLKEFEEWFLNEAASLKCKEIRSIKKLSCLGCVEKSAKYLDELGNG